MIVISPKGGTGNSAYGPLRRALFEATAIAASWPPASRSDVETLLVALELVAGRWWLAANYQRTETLPTRQRLCWFSMRGLTWAGIRSSFGAVAILHAIATGSQFGFDIMNVTGLTSGTVYPTLDRLEQAGLLKSRWRSPRRRRTARDGRRAGISN